MDPEDGDGSIFPSLATGDTSTHGTWCQQPDRRAAGRALDDHNTVRKSRNG